MKIFAYRLLCAFCIVGFQALIPIPFIGIIIGAFVAWVLIQAIENA